MQKQSIISQKALGEHLQELRLGQGISQEDLAGYLEVSRQAIGQIEKGERAIDAIELSKLAIFFEVSADSLLRPGLIFRSARSARLKTPNITFNPEKFRQVFLYVLSKLGGKPNFGETVLYKVLYFIDFNSYELTGKPITGLTYLRLERGPVPALKEFKEVVDAMESADEIRRFSQEYYGKRQKRYIALADSNIDVFSIKEKENIDRVIDEIGALTARQASEYAHGDAPWKLTSADQPIEYSLVELRQAPYALTESMTPAMSASGSDIVKYLSPMDKEETEHYANLI